MLTGNSPFKQDSFEKAVLTILNYDDNLSFPVPLTRAAQHFINCCVRKAPHHRRNAKQLLNHPFVKNAGFSFEEESPEEFSSEIKKERVCPPSALPPSRFTLSTKETMRIGSKVDSKPRTVQNSNFTPPQVSKQRQELLSIPDAPEEEQRDSLRSQKRKSFGVTRNEIINTLTSRERRFDVDSRK